MLETPSAQSPWDSHVLSFLAGQPSSFPAEALAEELKGAVLHSCLPSSPRWPWAPEILINALCVFEQIQAGPQPSLTTSCPLECPCLYKVTMALATGHLLNGN